MNTYFFVRLRLRRREGRRSFLYGPYVNIDQANEIIASVPDLLVGYGINTARYTVYVEERCLQQGSWVRVTTTNKIVADGSASWVESDRVEIKPQGYEE